MSISLPKNRDTVIDDSESSLLLKSEDVVIEEYGFSSFPRTQEPVKVPESNSVWMNPSPIVNWTMDYDRDLAEFALDFASAAYAPDPLPCLQKHGAKLIKRVQLSCDYVHDEVDF